MPDEPTTAAPAAPATPAGESQAATPIERTAPSITEGATPQQVAVANDQIYDAALADLLGDKAEETKVETPTDVSAQPATEANDATATATTPPADEGTPRQYTDQQVQLLGRLHMSPAQLQGWTDDQVQDFLSNAAKREADQTSYVKSLQDQVNSQQATDDQTGGTEGGQPNNQQQATPAGQLTENAQKAVDAAVETFGRSSADIVRRRD